MFDSNIRVAVKIETLVRFALYVYSQHVGSVPIIGEGENPLDHMSEDDVRKLLLVFSFHEKCRRIKNEVKYFHKNHK